MTLADKLLRAKADYDEVYEAGQKSEYDFFWDAFQENGNRRTYTNAFGYNWTKEAFKPKYDLIVGIAKNYTMFANCPIEGSLTEILNELGITLYFEGGYSSGTFNPCEFSEIDISTSNCFNTFASTFGCKKLTTLKLPAINSRTVFNATAFDCPVLENLTLSGVIGTSINFQYSPLTPESMKNVISCLKDYSGTSNEYVHKVTFTEECWTALEEDSTAPDGNTWANYVFNLGWST